MVSAARVVINREAVKAVDMALLAGLETAAVEVLSRVRPPDAAPFGVGLVTQGGYVAYVDGKKVGGDADKPRRMAVRGKGIVVGVGFGFPGKFQEMGTVNQPPRPFLSPVVMDVVGESVVADAARAAMAGALRGIARGLARRAT